MSVQIAYGTENIKQAVALVSDLVNTFINMGKISVGKVALVLGLRITKLTKILRILPSIKAEIEDLTEAERNDLKGAIAAQIEDSTLSGKIAESILKILVDMSAVFDLIELLKRNK